MRWLLTLIFLTAPYSLMAKKTCDADSIVRDICSHFYKNKDQPHIKTSDGGLITNPYYSQKVSQADQTTFMMNQSPTQFEDFINADLAFQIDSEVILKNSKAKEWSTKALRIASGSHNVGALLARVFPDDPDLKMYFQVPVYFPGNLRDPDSSVKTLNEQQIENIIEELGPDTIKQLKERFSNLPKRSMQGGGFGNAKPSDAGDNFKRVLNKTVREDQDRQKELTRIAKKSIIEMIKNGRPDSQLTIEQKNLIGRVTSVELLTADSAVAKSNPECNKQTPQAFFNPQGYNIILCENLLDLPDAAMLRIIAHEIGHSIDPCTASCDHLSVNQEKVEQYLSSKPQPSESEGEEDPYDASIEELTEHGDRPFITYVSADNTLKNKLIKNGMLNLNFKGLPRSQQPFNSVRSCLIKSAKFDNVSPQDIAIAIHQWKSAQKRLGKEMTPAEVKQYEIYFKSNSDCIVVGTKMSQMSESMADVYAAYALSNFLKENPPKTENDKFAVEGFMVGPICDPNHALNAANSLKNGGFEILEQPHPIPTARTKNILLQFPGIADHFDCDFKKSNSCFDRFKATATKAAPRTAKPQGAQE